ncbi:MAG: UvrD-helicase domain-containing protein [Rikenellaceae bacterium]
MRATIYNASAGSGKTYRLAYRYVKEIISSPRSYRHILAVTFTNKATEQMRTRILSEIHTLASGAESGYTKDLMAELELDEPTIRERAREARALILHNYSRFTVLTIDTFFQRILRAFIQELGIELGYNIELESSTILEKSADELIEEITTDDELRGWLMGFIEERIEDGKKWDIREGVLTLSGELFKESNRESLKNSHTKEELSAILRRIESQRAAEISAYRSLATKAIEIMANAGVSPTDFSGKSNSFARIFSDGAKGEIKEPTKSCRAKRESSDKWAAKGSAAASIAEPLRGILSEMIEIYDSCHRSWNTTQLLKENYRGFALLSDLNTKLQQMCSQENMMLISETKLILSEFIKGNDAPFIYEKVGNRYDKFMIDEFQDTSLKEWDNFLPLLENSVAQSQKDAVLLVGDVKQSIYRWRGGDWRILHSKAPEALGKGWTEVINMDNNYRSLPLIVEFNNAIIEGVVEIENQVLNDDVNRAREEGKIDLEGASELHDMLKKAYLGHRQHPQKRAEAQGYVELRTTDDEPPVVECIKEVLDRGFSPSDIMILTRSKAEGVKVASMLLEFKASNNDEQYQFDVMTQEALIIGNAPVSGFIMAVMRLSLSNRDAIQRAIYNNFLPHKNFDSQLDIEEIAFLSTLRLQSPEEAFEQIVMRYELGSKSEDIAYLQAIHEQIIAYTTSRIGDISLFLKWWDEKGAQRSLALEASGRSIEITTIHKAKGLEKSVVIIPYCSWSMEPKSNSNIVWSDGWEELGRFPVKYKKIMGESSFSADYLRERIYTHIDNVNLLYVALTRAVESLHIFVPSKPRNIDKLLLEASQRVEAMRQEDGRLCLGQAAPPIAKQKKSRSGAQITLEHYPSSPCEMRLRLPAARYREDAKGELTPRDMGIMMHHAFEQATSEEMIFERLEQMRQSSLISQTEHTAILSNLKRALENPTIKSWFSDEWEELCCEREIIMPSHYSTRRPDRVMISGERAVVVDYKFGELNHSRHLKQIREYMHLLKEMGYREVYAYLWYIKTGEIISV